MPNWRIIRRSRGTEANTRGGRQNEQIETGIDVGRRLAAVTANEDSADCDEIAADGGGTMAAERCVCFIKALIQFVAATTTLSATTLSPSGRKRAVRMRNCHGLPASCT